MNTCYRIISGLPVRTDLEVVREATNLPTLDDLAVDEERRLAAVSRQISSALAAWTSAG